MGISISVCTAVLSFCILNHVFFYKIASIPYSTLSACMLVKPLLFVSHILKCGMIVMLYDKLDNTGSAERRGSLEVVGFLNETLHTKCKDASH